MSESSDGTLHEVREAIQDPRVRVERDGKYDAVRFVWEGGNHGLSLIGFEPALPRPHTREDVPAWLLQRPGKDNITAAYREIKDSCWDRRPYEDRLRQRERDLAAEAVRLANQITLPYNALLGAAAAVEIVRLREGLPSGGLRGLWGRSTGYLVGDDPTPEMHPLPTDAEWRERVALDIEPLAGLYPAFAEAVTASVRVALRARTQALSESSAVRAREVVVAEFLHALGGEGPHVRPRLNHFWTWPWSELNVDDAFLGVLAMRLFKNDSAHLARYRPGLFSTRPNLKFEHAASNTSTREPADLLVLKPEHASEGETMALILESLKGVWQLYAGGQFKRVESSTVLRQLETAVRRRPVDLTRGLREEDALFLQAALGRFSQTNPNPMSVKDVVPLAALVAVAFENKRGRLLRTL